MTREEWLAGLKAGDQVALELPRRLHPHDTLSVQHQILTIRRLTKTLFLCDADNQRLTKTLFLCDADYRFRRRSGLEYGGLQKIIPLTPEILEHNRIAAARTTEINRSYKCGINGPLFRRLSLEDMRRVNDIFESALK